MSELSSIPKVDEEGVGYLHSEVSAVGRGVDEVGCGESLLSTMKKPKKTCLSTYLIAIGRCTAQTWNCQTCFGGKDIDNH